jgi:hypothetical protein
VSNIVQKAIDFAVAIAKDDSHGYDQGKRDGKPDYDCSSLMIASWQNAGVKVKEAGATYTGNMKAAFLKCGFTEVVSKVNIKTGAGLIPGDVLLHEGKHTAMCIGNKQIVHAAINEKGKITGGKSGDQTGKEIWVRSYYNHPWKSVLRFTEEMTVKEFQKAFALEVDGIVGPITRSKMEVVLKLIRKYVKG